MSAIATDKGKTCLQYMFKPLNYQAAHVSILYAIPSVQCLPMEKHYET